MEQVHNVGNMPSFLKTFLEGTLLYEARETKVWDCTYDEIINRAQDEKLEPQVLIDKKNTGKAFLCAVGTSLRKDESTNSIDNLSPVFYFSELDESRKRMFIADLNIARQEAINKAKLKLEQENAVKEMTRKAGQSVEE